MLVSELKQKIEAGKNINDLVEVKQYLSIVEKHIIGTRIIDSCIKVNDNGISVVDYFYKFFITDLSLLNNYTNLEFEEDSTINDYDYLAQNGYLDNIIDVIPESEVDFILDLVDCELDQILKINNGIENIIASKLEKLISAIPDEKSIKKIMQEAKKQINGIKPENLSILKDVLQKQGGQVG